MAILFVTHDLAAARVVADRIAVMYLGRIVEIGPAEEVAAHPTHPYTKALLAAVPGAGVERVPLLGEPASAVNPPGGCAFHPRCEVAIDVCGNRSPDLSRIESDPAIIADRPAAPPTEVDLLTDEDHRVACVHAGSHPEMAV